MNLPQLRRNGSATQLFVDGRPYLALGGELFNSTSSDPAQLEKAFQGMAEIGTRTAIATVSWEQVEPAEGALDFTSLEALLAAARAQSMRLVLIWFGAFKNAGSSYAPSWVRADRQRFPRATVRPGLKTAFTYEGAMPKPVLSVFSPELRSADCAAYSAMITYLRDNDPLHTVIMVQVENESGLLGDSRDRSELAEVAWSSPIPAAVRALFSADPAWLEQSEVKPVSGHIDDDGTWSDVFGDQPVADQMFMSWAFASYINQLSAAGKQILALPTYANAWLGPQPGQELPGLFPSGGPTARMHRIWKAVAPSLDFLAPDIYIDPVSPVLAEYTAEDNPLFVPEAKLRAGDVFLALGEYRAIGYCAFGIEEARPDSRFATAVRYLGAMSDQITTAQAEDRICGVLLDDDADDVTVQIGRYDVTIRNTARLFSRMLLDAGVVLPVITKELVNERKPGSYRFEPADDRPFGLIITLDSDNFLLVGQGFTADFTLPDGKVEIDRVVEQRLNDGKLVDGRIINGDERLQILPTESIGAARISLLPH